METPHENCVPEPLREEQREVERQICEAFRGVCRDDGMSWTEALVIDEYGSQEDMNAARSAERKHQYQRWENLVDDPTWDEQVGFNYLDASGFRYYIAPAMIRCVRRGWTETVDFALEHPPEGFIDILDEQQAKAIARFVRFMIKVQKTTNDDVYGEAWEKAYYFLWRRWDEAGEDP